MSSADDAPRRNAYPIVTNITNPIKGYTASIYRLLMKINIKKIALNTLYYTG
jgi:hypothetical protein